MPFTVYRITGPEFRSYIGCTSRTPETRFAYMRSEAKRGFSLGESGVAEAIRQHGADAFEVETICVLHDPRMAARVEAQLIERIGTERPNGFNIMRAGFPVAKFAAA